MNIKLLLSNEKVKKVLIGAAVAGVGAGATYALELLPTLSIPPEYLPIVTAVLSVVANIARKIIK